jgi:hypothetical protein
LQEAYWGSRMLLASRKCIQLSRMVTSTCATQKSWCRR